MKSILMSRKLMFIGLVLIIAMSSINVSLAEHETDPDNPELQHIVFEGPETYAQCVDAMTSDTIRISNSQDPSTGDSWSLHGFVRVEYLTDSGRVPVPGGSYEIDHIGDLELEVVYPPVSEWPVFIGSAGLPISEIHVDVSIEVHDQGGYMVGSIAIGPRHDWDVYCQTPSPPPPVGEDGCTPGFWKNHETAWQLTAYSPGLTVGSVFVLPPDLSSLSSDTLVEALSYGGGPKEIGAAKILLRASIAALLNASHDSVEYPESVSQVLSQVNAALASLDRDTMLNLAAELDAQNNLGCPIDN